MLSAVAHLTCISPVTKAQIVGRIAVATGLTKAEAEAVVDGVMLTVIAAV